MIANTTLPPENSTSGTDAQTVQTSGSSLSSTLNSVEFNCYTKLEFMVLMAFVVIVILAFITLFMCVMLLHDHRCCFKKKSRRNRVGTPRTQYESSSSPPSAFTPCKWWNGNEEDAQNLSALFHDRVNKLRRENNTGTEFKEYMERLIEPDQKTNARNEVQQNNHKLWSVNESANKTNKKLLISVPRTPSSGSTQAQSS